MDGRAVGLSASLDHVPHFAGVRIEGGQWVSSIYDSGVDIIARKLDRSPGTIRNHLKQLFAKTRTRRQAELVHRLLTTVLLGPS